MKVTEKTMQQIRALNEVSGGVSYYPTIYKKTNAGAVQSWAKERRGDEYRTASGKLGGKIVLSAWRKAEPTNVGRSNARDGEEQADFEIMAAYQRRLEGEYHLDVDKIGTPNNFKPMLASKYDKFADLEKVIAKKKVGTISSQPKLDGMRCIAKSDGLWSRSGKSIDSVPHIWERIKPWFDDYPEAVLDGELYNHELKDDFNTIMSLARKSKPTAEDLEQSAKMIQFHVYDGYINEDDAQKLFQHRFTALAKVLIGRYLLEPHNLKDPVIHVVKSETFAIIKDHSDAHLEEWIDESAGDYLSQGYEGQILRLNSEEFPYENRRSKGLLKHKKFMDQEYKLISIEEGKGNWAGTAKRLVCELPDGRRFGSGIKGTAEQMAEFWAERDEYAGGEATIRFFELTPDGVPRFPVAYGLYKTKRDT